MLHEEGLLEGGLGRRRGARAGNRMRIRMRRQLLPFLGPVAVGVVLLRRPCVRVASHMRWRTRRRLSVFPTVPLFPARVWAVGLV